MNWQIQTAKDYAQKFIENNPSLDDEVEEALREMRIDLKLGEPIDIQIEHFYSTLLDLKSNFS